MTELIGQNPLRNVAIIIKKNIKRLYREKRTFFWGLNYFIFLQVQTTTTAFQQVASVKDTIWSTKSNPKIEHVGAFHGLTVSVQFKVKNDTHTVCIKEVRDTFAILDVAAGFVMKCHLQSSFFRCEPLLSEILDECHPHKLKEREKDLTVSCISLYPSLFLLPEHQMQQLVQLFITSHLKIPPDTSAPRYGRPS